MTSGDALDQVWALVGRETVHSEDKPEVSGRLQRLCRAAAAALPATGVGVSVMREGGDQVSVAASSEVNEEIEELQFVLGEGPCMDAHDSRSPVLMADLSSADRTRWPGYAPAAQEFGVRAVFAFPLQVGAARLGALDVYQDRAGPLTVQAMSLALTFADVAMQILLDAQHDTQHPDNAGSRGNTADTRAAETRLVGDALGARLEVYQAQGMVMVQLDVSLQEAMSRLRAHAYVHDRRLNDVAADVVARKLRLEGDSE
jgi:hypothetical protein